MFRRPLEPRASTWPAKTINWDISIWPANCAGALDQFDDVCLIPFWAVAALAVAYIVLLFPLSYWLIARGLRRQTLAWAAFAVVIVFFCTAAYALANYSKGGSRRVNQIDLTDVDLTAGHVRAATWMNIFSPENVLYDLRSPAEYQGNFEFRSHQ